jgi:hypothetical protein
MGKIFARYSSHRGLVSRICKELKKIKHQMDNPINKWQNKFGHFSNDEVHMVNEYMKKCPTSLAIREMQIKMTLRFHLSQ